MALKEVWSHVPHVLCHPNSTCNNAVRSTLVNIAFISANHTYTVKKCICIITFKHYQSCDDSVWLVQSGYSVWGHQNDLHVITLMKQHFSTEKFSVHKVNWNSKLKVKLQKGGKERTAGHSDGTFQVLTWNFNNSLTRNEARWQINNWKLT